MTRGCVLSMVVSVDGSVNGPGGRVHPAGRGGRSRCLDRRDAGAFRTPARRPRGATNGAARAGTQSFEAAAMAAA